MRIEDHENPLRRTAYDWHGGQGSPLYSFASTGAVWTEDHRAELLAEIEDCEGTITATRADRRKLHALAAYVSTVALVDEGTV